MNGPDLFATATDIHSIVIVGAMNSAIHHPVWYRDIGALDDAELASTGASPNKRYGPPLAQSSFFVTSGGSLPICTPAFSQFTANNIRVACIEQSWTISTTERSQFLRIRDMANIVFRNLQHTPVSAFGLNFTHHRKASTSNVGEFLAKAVEATPFKFQTEPGATSAGKITHVSSGNGRTMTMSVEQSVRGLDMAFIAINAHHPIVPAPGSSTEFDLAPLLNQGVDRDLLDEERFVVSILEGFSPQSDEGR
jgi:hypothetical protein